MAFEVELGNSPLIIAYQNNEGLLVPIQSLDQYLYGERDLRILCSLYGRKLFDILYDDHGYIQYSDNKVALKEILRTDTTRAAMSIMGKIGESVIVRRCTQYKNLNREWMRTASLKNTQQPIADQYRAVGTGFKSTERFFPTAYDPNNKQRDIIWIHNIDGMHYQMNGSTGTSGLDAGLQVKVSTDGMRYVYNDVVNNAYEVPIVYFDLRGDFWKVYKNVEKKLKERGEDTRQLSAWFISAREADEDAYDEVEHYADMVIAMVKGALTPLDLINRAELNKSFGTAVLAGTFEGVSNETYLEASDDWDNRIPKLIF